MVVFLDVDGVMIPSTGWRVPENLEDGFPMFSKRAINALKELLMQHPVNQLRVILTTSHRDRFSIKEWKGIFQRRGLNLVNIERLSPNPNFIKKRNEEILEWFSANKAPEDFLIIDDDKSLNTLPSHLKDHLVLTSASVGLRVDDLPVLA